MARTRVIVFCRKDRSQIAEKLEQVHALVARHAEIVSVCETDDDDARNDQALFDSADLAVVLGGDGTLLHQARRMVAAGADIPLVGVNFGRLGFLAEFDLDSISHHASGIFGGHPPVRRAMMLQVSVMRGGKCIANHAAINDAVITAGPPFRMIELSIALDGDEGPVLSGDGVIVATPVGSTAYNVSAGGPIVAPGVEAMTITPLSPHSLAFRPLLLPSLALLKIEVRRANEGTALVIDGQEQVSLSEGDRVEVERHQREVSFVTNPDISYWRILLDKMRWAAPPSYRDRGA